MLDKQFVYEYNAKVRFGNRICGEVAQLARAHGSYPWCRGFESPLRYFFYALTGSLISDIVY